MLLFDTQQIGNRLLAIRKRLGLTQSEAAELCGLSGRAYADIERGEVNMRIQTVQRICRAFHITPDEILTAENEPLAADQDALFARLQGCRPKETLISTADSSVKVCVIPTNEELAICRETVKLVG